MGAFRQLGNSLTEIAAIHFHYKVKDITAGFATETVIQLVLPVHGKRRGFFAVERTEPPVFPAFFIQGHITGNDLNDVRPTA